MNTRTSNYPYRIVIEYCPDCGGHVCPCGNDDDYTDDDYHADMADLAADAARDRAMDR